MGNSQFQLLKAQVKAMEAELARLRENQGSEADVAAQRKLLEQSRQQQVVAKQVLMDPQSSADDLEAAAPFLPTRGLQEQARLDARSKRAWETMEQPQFVLDRTDLIDGMKNAYSTGEYQQWRDAMKQRGDTTFADGKKLPNGKTKPSANAMKAANQLAQRTFRKDTPIGKAAAFKPAEKRQSTKPIPLSRFFDE